MASNSSFRVGGQGYGHDSIECYAYATPEPYGGTVPLDLYWSAERKDTWALASDASRAQAEALGYERIGTTGHVPAAC